VAGVKATSPELTWGLTSTKRARMDTSLLRHIYACTTARLPGARVPWRIGAQVVGYAAPALTDALAPYADRDGPALVLRDPAGLEALVVEFGACGLFRVRDEAFDVKAVAGGPALARVDRGALPALGLLAEGVHVNGLVRTPDGPCLWVGRRAPHKALDPDRLDHLVAGGVPAGLTPTETLVKEAAEEASIPPELARQATWHGTVAYAMERPEGLRRDVLHCADLWLPAGFVPRPNDDEVVAFALWPLPRVVAAVRATDDFKFNVPLVLIDLFIRMDLLPADEAAMLRAALDGASADPL
jgi:8-oxo-dGTP pyrophosphatase MutT (NUDIX family)